MTITTPTPAVLPESRVAPWAARPRQPAQAGEAIVVGSMLRLPIEWIEPGPNVRGKDVGDVSELAAAITANGQEQPMLVWQRDEHRYVTIEGHRRRKAILLAGLPYALVVLRRRPGDCDRIVRQLSMHTHAKPFEPLAEARALHELMFEHKLSREQIAAQVGRNPVWVRDRIALLRLTAAEQAAVQRRDLPLAEALEIVRDRRGGAAGLAPTGSGRVRPVKPARREQHFTKAHRLANDAGQSCRDLRETHGSRPLIGGVACGECWESAIRADLTAAVEPVVAVGVSA